MIDWLLVFVAFLLVLLTLKFWTFPIKIQIGFFFFLSLIIGCFGHIGPAFLPEDRESEQGHSSHSRLSICSAGLSASPSPGPAHSTGICTATFFSHWDYLAGAFCLWILVTVCSVSWFLVEFFFYNNSFRQIIKMNGLGSIVLFVYKFLKHKQNIWKIWSKIAEV